MLLLLKSPPSGIPAGTLAAFGSLSASGSTQASNLSGSGSLTLSAIELHVFATYAASGNLQALPQNFRVGAGALTANGNLSATVGFGPSATLAAFGNLSGTVGTVFQGIGALNAQGGLTVSGVLLDTGKLIALGNLAATGQVTGGVVTPSALLAAHGDLVITGASFALNANLSGQGDLSGFGFPQQVGFATQMRISFSADEIRVFFRKG